MPGGDSGELGSQREPYIRRPILESVSAISRVLSDDISNQRRGSRSLERRKAAQARAPLLSD